MSELSITRAWSEALEFLRQEFAIVSLIGLLFIALPGAAMDFVIPQPAAGVLLTPEETWQMLRPMFMFMPFLMILSMIGTIAISYLAIRPGASVGEALAVGARRFIILLLAGLLIGLAAVIAFIPLFVMIAPNAGATPALAPLFLIILVSFVLFVAIWVKLILLTPIVAIEPVGPIRLLARSWELTRGHFWKLLGFAFLFGLVAGILFMVVSMLLALVLALTLGSPLEQGSGAYFAMSLLTAGVQALLGIAFCATIAKIYAQLTGAVDREIFA